jgi:hypothetical protein
MALGRITRFAKTPRGARRVSVMRRGAAGLKALAPSVELLEEFERARKRLDGDRAAAARAVDYARRFTSEIRRSTSSMEALRSLVAEAATRDVYLMCMCPYRTPGRVCHTYLLLDLARELAPDLPLADEPAP